MRDFEELLAIVRSERALADDIASHGGAVIHDVRLRGDAQGEPFLQVVYSLPGHVARLGTELYLPRDGSDQEIRDILESFFSEIVYEPSDMSRGLWADGVWWWAPGTVPLPRLDP